MSAELERFGVSMEAELLRRFDHLLEHKGYPNRSEALRDLVRAWVNDEVVDQDHDQPAMGTLTLFYDHTRQDLADRLTDIGHENHDLILTTVHFHIDHDRCLEMIALKGTVGALRNLADQMTSLRGVENGKLLVTAQRTGRAASHSHGHRHPHSHGHSHSVKGAGAARARR